MSKLADACEHCGFPNNENRESSEITNCPCCGCDHATLIVCCPDCKEESCWNGSKPTGKPVAEIANFLGHYYLTVNGYALAMEGDICRDCVIGGKFWTKDTLKIVADQINAGKNNSSSSGISTTSLPNTKNEEDEE